MPLNVLRSLRSSAYKEADVRFTSRVNGDPNEASSIRRRSILIQDLAYLAEKIIVFQHSPFWGELPGIFESVRIGT